MSYNLIRMSLCLLSFLTVGLYSCKDKPSGGTVVAEKKDSTVEGRREGLIDLTQQQMKAVGIEIGPIGEKNLHAVVKSSGQLAVPPQNKADVNVLMGGIIRTINVLEGQPVKKGQELAVLENTEFIRLQQEYLTVKSQFAYTGQELSRQNELSSAGAGTGKSLQQVQANYNAEKARIMALEQQLLQLGIDPVRVSGGSVVSRVRVTAPIAGTIGHITINTGTYVQAGKPLMEIIDNSKIHCDLVVYEKDLFKVKVGQKVNFILTNQNNQQIQGEIYGVNKSFEDESKGIIVHAIIRGTNTYRLIPGMYVTALIDVGNQLTQAVPVDALVRSEGKDYIFVMKEEKADKTIAFKKMEVVTGVSELGYVQISPLEELPSDARIITKGAFYLLSKEKAKGEEEE
ncbi:efflux RND transporter periplasmic adaptor subunit [Flavitalea sp. BT771]|uniref:efflux RND transporter periplasmic adaptor subunit n=1 Tax=Flavitalea sp. BT771 TaxID=3063329 RepID=UPI0026E46E41|nr:efflux RND transporter periplasmic adaptor subunit [Flavitalea sp. BT771]MDO6430375.1 efflux RND transporter periplasmic adaptor subunit [Flavitalea sp. BT771]MDV6219485.1 efflux RND transporter periplasmic adaptor subunit [Flavitalea sp. BT771]